MMTELGEIKRGYDIGRKYKNNFIWAACETCGKERWVACSLREAKPKYSCCASCSRRKGHWQKRGEASLCWKGGRFKSKNGYIFVALSPDDFFFSMADHRGYALEHRLVMAKALGRCLQPWEIVHHKNHKRDDNGDENLELATDAGHRQITRLETILRRQQVELERQAKEIRLLKWQIKELTREHQTV